MQLMILIFKAKMMIRFEYENNIRNLSILFKSFFYIFKIKKKIYLKANTFKSYPYKELQVHFQRNNNPLIADPSMISIPRWVLQRIISPMSFLHERSETAPVWK